MSQVSKESRNICHKCHPPIIYLITIITVYQVEQQVFLKPLEWLTQLIPSNLDSRLINCASKAYRVISSLWGDPAMGWVKFGAIYTVVVVVITIIIFTVIIIILLSTQITKLFICWPPSAELSSAHQAILRYFYRVIKQVLNIFFTLLSLPLPLSKQELSSPTKGWTSCVITWRWLHR